MTEIELLQSSKKIKRAPRAWFFDCDGPLTDPVQKKITTEGLPEAIGKKIIDQGEIAAINTGRSNSWLFKNGVMGEIEKAVSDKEKLDDFIAVGEKGATWSVYENNEWITNIDESIKVPITPQNEIQRIVENEFSDSMFFDDSKLSMISVEMLDGYSISEFSQRQKELMARLQEVLARDEYKAFELEIDPTTIATDIQNPNVGKHFGAKRIVDWLSEKGIAIDHFITVGDSTSDKEMADELAKAGKSVEFVFVNDPEKLTKTDGEYPVIFTKEKFGDGTLEFITSIHPDK